MGNRLLWALGTWLEKAGGRLRHAAACNCRDRALIERAVAAARAYLGSDHA